MHLNFKIIIYILLINSIIPIIISNDFKTNTNSDKDKYEDDKELNLKSDDVSDSNNWYDEDEVKENKDDKSKSSFEDIEKQSEEISNIVKSAVNGLNKKINDFEKKLSSESKSSDEYEDLNKNDNYDKDSAIDDTQNLAKEDDQKNHSPEYLKADKLFREGLRVLNVSGRRRTRMQMAYKYFQEAAEYNHTGALEYVAMGSLLGDGMSQNLAKARSIFQHLADQGNSRGQFGLGFLYAGGLMNNDNKVSSSHDIDDNINRGQAEAFLYLTFSALEDDSLGQMAISYRYFQGIGVDTNCEQSLAFYRRVATKVMDVVNGNHGDGTAGIVAPKTGGVHRIHLIEEAEANSGLYGTGSTSGQSPVQMLLDDDLLQYYHFLAEKGDVSAQVGLGHLYFEGGRGVNIDHEKALYYLKQASDNGNTNAMAYLGQMYLEGSDVVPADNMTAFNYFKKSSDLGNALGMSGLGLMYLHGRGVDRDYSKAFKYFSMSTQHGLVEGQLQLGIMYFKGLGMRTDYKTAKKYFELAAQQGNIVAIYNLARMYAYGTGVVRSCTTASELFKSVAERGRWSGALMEAHRSFKQKRYKEAFVKYLLLAEIGYEVAQSNVAFMLEQGHVKFMTHEEGIRRAFMMLHRSASQGYVISRVKLGDYYFYGTGTNVDYEKSAFHYRIASEDQHNPQAMFNLGYMHEYGFGVNRDIHLAKRFYDMAESTSVDAQLPVRLALTKLQFHFFLESFRLSDLCMSIINYFNPAILMGPMWDLYLVAGLIGLLTLLVFLYQNNRRLLLINLQQSPNPPRNQQPQNGSLSPSSTSSATSPSNPSNSSPAELSPNPPNNQKDEAPNSNATPVNPTQHVSHQPQPDGEHINS